MINKDPVAAVLVALLFLCVLGTAVLCYTYASAVKQLQAVQLDAAQVNRNRALLNALGAEAVEYSRRNPAIIPLLQSAGLKLNSGASASSTNASEK